jgi:hypothetical protein
MFLDWGARRRQENRKNYRKKKKTDACGTRKHAMRKKTERKIYTNEQLRAID